MSDDITFEDPGVEEAEVVVVDSEDDIPQEEVVDEEKLALKKELEEYKQKASSADALRDGVTALGDKLAAQKSQEIPRPPELAKEMTKEEFNEKIYGENAKEFFDDYLDQRDKKRQPSQVNNDGLVYIAKNQMKLDPEKKEFYLEHEKEIEAAIATLPANQRANPMSVEWAYKEVSKLHQEDIVEKLVKERVAAALKEQGIDTVQPPAQFMERGRTTAPPIRKKSNTIYMTKEQKDAAFARGIPEDQYARLLKEKKI